MNHPSISGFDHWQKRLWQYGLWVCFILIVIYHVIRSLLAVSPFDQGMMDGPFQLFNWLRRMDAGEVPGRDFPCFHGIGIPLVHYPLYRVLGGGLFGMEISRQLVCRLSTLAAYLIVSRLTTKSYTAGVLWSLTTLLPDMDWGAGQWKILTSFAGGNALFAFEPGNSMPGLRGLLPLIFVATCFLPSNWKIKCWQMLLLSGSFFCGIENGMALFLGLFGTLLLLLVSSFFKNSLLIYVKDFVIVLVGGALLTFLGMLAVCGSSGLPRYLAFHFRSQIQDQTWFFGSPPNNFLLDGYSWTLVLAIIAAFVVAAIGMYLLWLCRNLIRSENPDQQQRELAKIVGLSFGVISLASLLGYVNPGGTVSFTRIVYLLLTVAVTKRLSEWSPSRATMILLNCILWSIILFAAIRCVSLGRRFTGVGISERYRTHLELAAPIFADHQIIAQPQLLWPAYAGLYESELGIYAPTEWDYIIHALGADRQEYFRKYAEVRPKYVTTSKHAASVYEEWLRTALFPLYRPLLFHYKILAETPFMYIWQRSDDAAAAVAGEPVVLKTEQPLHYVVPALPKDDELSLFIIDVEYQTKNPLRWLPLLGNSPRYLVELTGAKAGNPVSLSPFQTSQSFPVIPVPGQTFRLDFVVRGIRWDAEIDVQKVTATKVTLDPANKQFLKPSLDYRETEKRN